MAFEWLAALAYPRSIANHPNFKAQAKSSGPATLAAAILEESELTSVERDATDDQRFASHCVAMMSDPSSASRDDLIKVLNDPRGEICQRACAGIVLVGLELEYGLPRKEILDRVIEDASRHSSPAGRLAWLWLRLAAAVIATEHGEESRAEFRAIRNSIEQLGPDREIDFPTAAGLDLSAQLVFERIADLLSHAALRWEIDLEQLGGDLWMSSLRRPVPYLLSGIQSGVARGYAEWAKRTYQEGVRRQVQIIGGSLLPGDDSMITAVLVAQFSFHPYARQAAADLGRSRFLRAASLEDEDLRRWAVQSALTLMRFSRDRDNTSAAVAHTLRHGPLGSLEGDLADVIGTVVVRGAATHLEIDYLKESATLLRPDQARDLFGRMAAEFAGTVAPLKERWSVWWAREESIGKLLARLAGPGALGRDFLDLIGRRLEDDISEAQDRMLAASIRAAVDLPETDVVRLLGAAIDWSNKPLVYAALKSCLGSEQASRIPTVAPEGDSSPLVSATRFIDDAIIANEPPDLVHIRVHLPAVLASLDDLLAEGRKGIRTFGGIEPLNVAVAFATVGREGVLWPRIVAALADPDLARSQKAAAMHRIAKSAPAVPADIRDSLRNALPEMMATPGSGFDEGPMPFPAALQVAASLGLLDALELITILGPWCASSRPLERQHAITVLGAFQPALVPEWAIQSLMTLTFDSDPDVQADAIQALAFLHRGSRGMAQVIVNRANDLLGRDGTWLVRKVLAELEDESATALRQRLDGRVHALTRHRDWNVRRAASRVLSADSIK